MSDVAVLIPTLRRPDSLARAVRSLFLQTGVETRLREIVVVDNDPDRSAASVVAELKAESPAPLHYVHEPHPGVATARNAGLRTTEAPLIAFLDDDETASPQWLASLIAALEGFEADAVFGPIEAVLPETVSAHRDYLQHFFSRRGPERSGVLTAPFGCGGSLLRRATALPGVAPFDTDRDETGGEDDVLFARLLTRGGRLAWAAEALAFEHVPPARARLGYTLPRAFAYGQGPVKTSARTRNWLAVSKWMVIGAGQVVVFGALAAAAWALRLPQRAALLDRMVRGTGKVLWAPGFELRFYGAAGLARISPPASAAN